MARALEEAEGRIKDQHEGADSYRIRIDILVFHFTSMCPIVDVVAISVISFLCYNSDSLTVSVILPAITTSISCYIPHQLLVPINNRIALQIVFGELLAVDRTAWHRSRIESL